MQPSTTTAIATLSADIDEAIDVVESAIGEPAASEDVREARATVARIRERYEALVATLAEPERSEAQRAIGLKVAKMTGLLLRLES